MVRCEMCGQQVESSKKVKVEGAELRVCDECSDHGTQIAENESDEETKTKYSTSSTASGDAQQQSSSSSTTESRQRSSDMFDEMGEVVADYDERIRQAREDRGLSRADLADKLNEKESRIAKLEQGQTLPDSDIQVKLERELDISLSTGGGDDDDWESDDSTTGLTLGDVVKRDE